MTVRDTVPERSPSQRRTHILLDSCVALVSLGLVWAPALFSSAAEPLLLALGWLLALVASTCVLFRWKFPLLATLTTMAITIVGNVLFQVADPMFIAAWTLYPLAVTSGFRRVLVRTSLFIAVIAVALLATTALPIDYVWSFVLVSAACLACSWALGSATGERIDIAAAAAQEHTLRGVAEERLELAREIHDVVAHSLGTIGVEAGVAAHIRDADTDELRTTLQNIEGESRRALGQVRGLLVSMRGEGRAERSSAPTMNDLSPLFERTRAAGVPVTAHLFDTDQVSEVDQLTIYRIIQESLTNVVRHASHAECWVTSKRAGDWLILTIDDNGPGLVVPALEGHGLRGMKERALLAGGSCSITNRADGGVRVLVELPLFVSAQRTPAAQGTNEDKR